MLSLSLLSRDDTYQSLKTCCVYHISEGATTLNFQGGTSTLPHITFSGLISSPAATVIQVCPLFRISLPNTFDLANIHSFDTLRVRGILSLPDLILKRTLIDAVCYLVSRLWLPTTVSLFNGFEINSSHPTIFNPDIFFTTSHWLLYNKPSLFSFVINPSSSCGSDAGPIARRRSNAMVQGRD